MREPRELESALGSALRNGADALLVPTSMVYVYQTPILEFAARNKWPTIYADRVAAEAGGLVAYGPNIIERFRLAASYVDRILKGAKPADLPVDQPTRFEFVVNLKTARALRLTVPQSVLLQADKIIR